MRWTEFELNKRAEWRVVHIYLFDLQGIGQFLMRTSDYNNVPATIITVARLWVQSPLQRLVCT